MSSPYKTFAGEAFPFGVTKKASGVNFALFSKHATSVTLALFDPEHPSRPIYEIPLKAKTGYIWHIFIENIPLHYLYAYRVDGPHEPPHCFTQIVTY